MDWAFIYLFLFIYYACSITIGNTTCFVGLHRLGLSAPV